MSDETLVWLPLDGIDPATAAFPAAARLGGDAILVFKTPTGFAGTEPLCPHQKVPLDTAVLMSGGTMIRCARHNFIFRLDSGAGVNCSGMRLKTYPIRLHEGRLEGALPAAGP
ncbi:MAG: Rieske 2Fe-2S domain-containing protein [Rhodospirillaceae bacterium]|nr:Rieske 2Fe-2S domain-containing protein [Rhodospirillaceae bacterium]